MAQAVIGSAGGAVANLDRRARALVETAARFLDELDNLYGIAEEAFQTAGGGAAGDAAIGALFGNTGADATLFRQSLQNCREVADGTRQGSDIRDFIRQLV
jgi:hypothetical protein